MGVLSFDPIQYSEPMTCHAPQIIFLGMTRRLAAGELSLGNYLYRFLPTRSSMRGHASLSP